MPRTWERHEKGNNANRDDAIRGWVGEWSRKTTQHRTYQCTRQSYGTGLNGLNRIGTRHKGDNCRTGQQQLQLRNVVEENNRHDHGHTDLGSLKDNTQLRFVMTVNEELDKVKVILKRLQKGKEDRTQWSSEVVSEAAMGDEALKLLQCYPEVDDDEDKVGHEWDELLHSITHEGDLGFIEQHPSCHRKLLLQCHHRRPDIVKERCYTIEITVNFTLTQSIQKGLGAAYNSLKWVRQVTTKE